MLNDEDFTDVTLACDDGQLVKAHKVILAAASPFFKRILTQAAHPNPLIHIQGIKAFHLKLMLHFIYLGRATIETGNIEEFFESTRRLKIEGLEEALEGERKNLLEEKTSSEKPFTCNDCSKGFTQKGVMVRHKKFYCHKAGDPNRKSRRLKIEGLEEAR